jgi:hypothetical protein
MIEPDADLESADWTKATYAGFQTRVELEAWLAASGLTLAQFKRLPVYRWNRDEIDAILGQG